MKTEEIIKENNNLIYKIASKFYGENKDDLYQAGVLGLLKALKNFKSDKAKFTTYAYDYIYGEMYNLVSNKTIKINKYILKLFKVIEQTRSALSQKLEHIPNNDEIAEFLNLDSKVVNDAVLAGLEVMSLDKPAQEEEDSLYNIVSNKEESIDENILISESLNMLTKDEQSIIKARYYEDLTQSEVAKKLAMTQVMVSRYEKKGLSKMQEFMLR